MKNYEKYADKIKEYEGDSFCSDFVMPYILKSVSLKSVSCGNVACDACRMLQMMWLLEDYEEPEVDWSKVEVDTPILVRDREDSDWCKKHFAKLKNGIVHTWTDGATSWSTKDNMVVGWNYAKLAEGEKAGGQE